MVHRLGDEELQDLGQTRPVELCLLRLAPQLDEEEKLQWSRQLEKVHRVTGERWDDLVFPIHGGSSIAGWFISWNILNQTWWFRGTPMDLKPPVATWNTNLEHLSIIWGTMIPKTLLPSSQDGMELLYAPEAVQADRELVMTAVPSQFFWWGWAGSCSSTSTKFCWWSHLLCLFNRHCPPNFMGKFD